MMIKLDNIYPARQFHFRTDKTMTEADRKNIESFINLAPGIGFVACEFTPRRIIITTTSEMTYKKDTEMIDILKHAIELGLGFLEI